MLPAHRGRRPILLLPLENGERPLQAESASGTALGLSAWGRGLGGRRGSEAPRPFLLESTTENGGKYSGLALSRFLLPKRGSGLPRECFLDLAMAWLPWGDTPSWGGNFSSSARPDPRRVRAAGHPDLAVFLSVAEEAGEP